MNSVSNVSRFRQRCAGAGLLSLALATSLSGCDDFLATQPLGELSTESFFKDETQAIQATNATYSIMRAFNVHVFQFIGLTDIVSDDATKGSVPADAAFLLDVDNLNFDPGNTAFSNSWIGYYQGVYRANAAIQKIPDAQMDATLQARLIGENRFLRAYFYFFLVRAFGGVPLITEPLQPNAFVQPRATEAEIWAFIKEDLEAAIPALPERSQYAASDLGRATKGAARALLGQVHLYLREYPQAYDQLTTVINSGEYSLFEDYETLFTDAGEYSRESVFEVGQVALETGGGGGQYGQVQGIRAVPRTGWGFNTASDQLEAHYEPGDERRQATILYPWETLPDGSGRVVYINPSMLNNRYNQKAFVSPENPRGSGNSGVNIRRIRYADVLLMAAEAAFRTGNTGAAQGYLNQVRARARDGNTITLGFNAELMGEVIAAGKLGLEPAISRVFVRYVNQGSPAYEAGIRTFDGRCIGACGAQDVPPVQVVHADLIQTVNGSPVNSVAEFHTALNAQAPGSPVGLGVLRVQEDDSGVVSRTPMMLVIEAKALLPDVTVTGDALLEAIWRERRSELGLEQHRWFDIIRQNREMPGRAAALLAAHGKEFQPHFERYPIPLQEVQIAGLEQNPGYPN